MQLRVALIVGLWTVVPALADVPHFHRGVAMHLEFTDTMAHLSRAETEARNIAAAGFDFVRLTVDPFIYLDQQTDDRTKELNAGVLAAVKLIEKRGLKVVIDLHAIPKSGNRDLGSIEYAETGETFAAYGIVAASLALAIESDGVKQRAFEPFNEPVVDCEKGAPAKWPDLALQLHDKIRSQAPHVTLIMEGGCWGGAQGLSALSPDAFNDDNLIWSFHDYGPMIFTHQGASWVAGAPHYASGLPYPPVDTAMALAAAQSRKKLTRADVAPTKLRQRRAQEVEAVKYYFSQNHAKLETEEAFTRVAAWAESNRIKPEQILFGEFGAIRGSHGSEPTLQSRSNYLLAKRQLSEAHGWAWSVWEWSGSFGIAKNEGAGSIDPALANALGLSGKK